MKKECHDHIVKIFKKVIEYVNKGNSCNSASIKFEIFSNTVMNFCKRCKSEGNYLSRKIGVKRARNINNNPNFILSEMGNLFW